ncbi:RNA polymerase II mediator complex subunit [Malassezia furfur]|uniref:Mediator of RNA polymerase II transcription subunit 12 n=1 Tax=Malassezia furfur TaxID=55194 RepID=A0ABY8ENT1_MALFU|nr:RNA polymerase II mediator complex subunit [Malassezia furfur]
MPPDRGGLEAYALAAPAWRPPLHDAAELGWPGLNVPQPTELTSGAVRHGWTVPPCVANEGASVHEQIHDRLVRPATLGLLNALLDGVQRQRRAAHPHTLDAHAFAVPGRVTLNEAKRALYVRALVDPGAPLAHLARHVPHGYRGETLLEMLWHGDGTRPVPVPRAVWFVQACGASDVHAARRSHDQATRACTDAALAWLAAQLAAFPGAADEAAWAAKWSYSAALVHALRAQHLVDTYAYLAWLAAQTHTVRTGARVCVLQLVDDALPALAARASLAHTLAAALQPHASDTPFVAAHTRAVLARCAVLAPEALVGAPSSPDARIAARTRRLQGALAPLLTAPAHVSVADADAVQVLDTSHDAVAALFLRYFVPEGAAPDIAHRVALLLTWACTETRDGAGREYLAAALLERLYACQAGRLVLDDGRRVACTWAPISLFDTVTRWIDAVDAAGHTSESLALRTVSTTQLARLLGALSRVELFSFARFAQRLTARGLVRHALDGQRTHRHRTGLHARLFRAMPVVRASEAVRALRRSAIYGARTAESYEEATERRATRELWRACALLGDAPAAPAARPSPSPSVTTPSPVLRGTPLPGADAADDGHAPPSTSTTTVADAFGLPTRLPHLRIASPYIQARVVAKALPFWLDDTLRAPSADEFAFLATVLTSLGALPELAQLCVALLDRHVESRCVVSVCHTVAAHARVFAAVHTPETLVERLAPYAVHDASASVGQRIVPAQGRTMAVTAARAALAALTHERAARPPEAPAPSAAARAAAAEPAALLLHGDALDAASAALLAAVPLAEAPGAVWPHVLHALSRAGAQPPPPAVVDCLAALAGAAGVRLPVAPWMRATYALDAPAEPAPLLLEPTAPPASSAWCAVVAGLVRYGYVDAEEVLDVLCAYAPRAARTDAFYEPCVALSDALLCTTSVPGSPCSVATLGAAAWYDLGLLAKQHVRRDALVPWLVAIRGVPALQASLAPHLAALRTQWYTYPDAFVRGAARVAPADALDVARTYDPTTAPRDVHDAADVARVVAHASPWTASFALALLHCTLRMAPTHEQVALADALVPSLLPAPAAARGAPFEQLTRLGMPPAFPTELAHAALRRWMRGNEAAAHALARLAQHTRGLACDGVDAAMHRVCDALERDARAWASGAAEADGGMEADAAPGPPGAERAAPGVPGAEAPATGSTPLSASSLAPDTSSAASPRSPATLLATPPALLATPPALLATPPWPNAEHGTAGGAPRFLVHHLAVLLFLLSTAHARTDTHCAVLVRACTPLLTLAQHALASDARVAGAAPDVPYAELLADCLVQVQCAVGPAALEPWLRAAPAVAPPLARLVRFGSEPPPPPDAWLRLDTVSAPPPPASRDPWATPLANTAPISLHDVHARKTRDTVPHTTMRAAPPSWLTSEQSYGDGDSVPVGTRIRRPKRKASAALHPAQ